MISKDSIALAENIAVAIPSGLTVPESALLTGLNSVSHGAFPYNENFRDQIVDVTSNVTDHTEVMGHATTRMAEIIRGAFEMVKTYGVPLGTAIAADLDIIYSPRDLRQIGQNNLEIKFANIDDPFFESSIYPTVAQIKNTQLSFNSIGLEVLERLEFNTWPSVEVLRDFINTKHPEVLGIIEDTDECLGSAFEALTHMGALKGVFATSGNATVDFTQIKSVRINLLLKMYVLIGAMYLNDQPFSLEKGSLEDYRSYVGLMYSGITTYLVNLKRVVEQYRARKIVLVANEQPKLIDFTPHGAKHSIKVIKGNVTVFYTNEAMSIAEQNGVSLADATLAWTFGMAVGRAQGLLDLLQNKAATEELTGEYYGTIHQIMDGKAATIFQTSALSSATKFVNERPQLREALQLTLNDENASTATLLEKHLGAEIEKLYFLFAKAKDVQTSSGGSGVPIGDDYKTRCIDAIMKTKLIPNFLALLGCELASEILELTFVRSESEDNLRSKRERLHNACIELLASKLLSA
ncbi:hypothetical protein D3C81_287990 [compost metagenome]